MKNNNMNTLICVASYCTEENKRLQYAKPMFESLLETVDFTKHRLGIYLNAPCEEAATFFADFVERFVRSFPTGNLFWIQNLENIGTAKAINALMALRSEGENCIKMDDDMVINKVGWVDEMNEVIERMPEIYILGLKRRDLMESTYRNDAWRSELIEVPHERGQKWYIVEKCNHIMGSCTMFSNKCLEDIGGLYQMEGSYAFDDSLHSLRAGLAGGLCCFLHGIDVDHIDVGGDAYTEWKRKYAGERMESYNKAVAEFRAGILPLHMEID